MAGGLAGGLVLGVGVAVASVTVHLLLSDLLALTLGLILVVALLWAEGTNPGGCGIAGNFNVPAHWLTVERPGRVGLLWGAILGMGWITKAPFRLYHAVVVFGIIAPLPWFVSLGLLTCFGGSRALFGVSKPVRAWILLSAEVSSGWRMAALVSFSGIALLAVLIGVEIAWG